MRKRDRVLVAGAGGFVGHHLVRCLKAEGYWVRGVDLHYPQFESTEADEFLLLDLRQHRNCEIATRSVTQTFSLAANTGGIQYRAASLADIVRDDLLININMLENSWLNGVKRFLFTSSASVYPQRHGPVAPVLSTEDDAYPADPEPGMGWEKLISEQLCRYYQREGRLDTRIARCGGIYGPLSVFCGGTERAVPALCRKVACAHHGGEVEVWGDGKQVRSYVYIDDFVEGLLRLMRSDCVEPVNLGSDRPVTIGEVVSLLCQFSGKKLVRRYDMTRPQGARTRMDVNRMRKVLGWEPATTLESGLWATYHWIRSQCKDVTHEMAG